MRGINLAYATGTPAMYILILPSPNAYPRGCDSDKNPWAFDSATPVVLFCSFPPFSFYSTVGGGGGAGWDGTGADCGAGGARAGVSLPGVLLTRVAVLF
jgi:hypothetical protein